MLSFFDLAMPSWMMRCQTDRLLRRALLKPLWTRPCAPSDRLLSSCPVIHQIVLSDHRTKERLRSCLLKHASPRAIPNLVDWGDRMVGPFGRNTLRLYNSFVDGSVHLNRAMRDVYDKSFRGESARKQHQELLSRSFSARQILLIRQQNTAGASRRPR